MLEVLGSILLLLRVFFVVIYQAVMKKIPEPAVDKIQRHLPLLIHETPQSGH